MQVVAMQTLTRPAFVARPAAARRSSALRARTGVVVRAERPTWYPGATPPPYLDGSMPGDYGCDFLRLGANTETLPYLREAELTNGRWAMMAVVGILFTDLVGLPNWWEAAKPLDLPVVLVAGTVMAVLEKFRLDNWKRTGASGIGPIAPFDPLGMKSTEMEVKEVKNARLAMLAFLGFSSQAAVRGLGPIECLKLHLDDPGKNNIFTSAVGAEVTIAVMVLSAAPVLLQARKALSDGKEDDFRPIPGPW